MGTFLITYDLRQPGRNYASLYSLLDGMWGGQRLAESVWLAYLAGPPASLRDIILAHVDANDRVAVIEIPQNANWATWHGMPGGINMLSAHVLPALYAA